MYTDSPFFNDQLKETCLLLCGDESPGTIPDWVYINALKSHGSTVWRKSLDAITRNQIVVDTISNQEARYYLQYGLGRRLLMNFHAFRNLYLSIPPDRDAPLSPEQAREHSNSLNIIYMNIKGCMDNMALALVHEKFGTVLPKSENKIDLLYLNKFDSVEFRDISAHLSVMRDWYRTVKSLRDPVAHRIPLYIPDRTLKYSESDEYVEQHQQFLDSATRGDFEKSEHAFNRIQGMGTFLPVFAHHPDQVWHIYPTVAEDLAHLYEIIRISWGFISSETN